MNPDLLSITQNPPLREIVLVKANTELCIFVIQCYSAAERATLDYPAETGRLSLLTCNGYEVFYSFTVQAKSGD